MEMSFGKKVKVLRKAKGLSQFDLANQLNITSQAVSKWESEATLPDIQLLPHIAAIFGVSIDELLDYTKENMYTKIMNMLEFQRFLTNQEFMFSEEFLLNEIKENPKNHDAISLLGDLYHFQASGLDRKAAEYGKRALELSPNNKEDINIINNASRGKIYDWSVANHHELIELYYQILRSNKANQKVYFYLLDNLIDDGRFQEAKEVLRISKIENSNSLNSFYALFIEEKQSGFSAVKSKYLDLVKAYPKDWRILFSIANTFSANEQYEDAIPLWNQAFEAMEKPRYTDFHQAKALCYIRLGKIKEAVLTYQEELELLHQEWDIKFGAEVDELKEKIASLQEK